LLADTAYAALGAGDRNAVAHYAQAALDAGGDDTPAIARFLLASCYFTSDEMALAIEQAGRAVVAAEAQGDLTTQVIATGVLVDAHGTLGDEPAARRHIATLIELAEALGNPTISGISYMQAGDSLAGLGHPDEAVSFFNRALDYSETAGPLVACSSRVAYALAVSAPADAARLLAVALPMARDQLAGVSQVEPLIAAAKIMAETGRPELAAEFLGTYTAVLPAGTQRLHTYGWCEKLSATLADILGATVFGELVERGGQLAPELALERALELVAPEGAGQTARS